MTPLRRFTFRLAKELGYANPDAMLAIMPFRVFREWVLYARLEPFGERRADLRAAIIASTMANLWGRKKGQRPYKLDRFMPDFDAGARPTSVGKSPDQIFEQIKVLNQLMGGSFVDKRKSSGGN